MFTVHPPGTNPCPNSYRYVAGRVRRMCLNGRIVRDWSTGEYVNLIIEDDDNRVLREALWEPSCERCDGSGHRYNYLPGRPQESEDCVPIFGRSFWLPNSNLRWQRKLRRVKREEERRMCLRD